MQTNFVEVSNHKNVNVLTAGGILVSLGIVFGDIGTSPLYTLKAIFKTVKETEMYAIFSNDIKKHANKPFELEGYIVPIKDGMKQSKFMLSTLPINQCFFCGKNGVPIMVLVELVEPIKFTYQTVKIKGTLKLSTANAMDNPPISLLAGKAL